MDGANSLPMIAFAGIAAVTAVVNVILAWWIATETKRMRRAATEPHVTIALVSHESAMGFVDLVIRNQGAGSATDLRFEIVKITPSPIDVATLQTLESFGFVKTGIGYLPPGAEFRTYLAHVTHRTEEAMETNIHLRVRYHSLDHEQFAYRFPIDLRPFWHRMRAGTPPLHALLEEIKQVRRELNGIRLTLAESQPRVEVGEDGVE